MNLADEERQQLAQALKGAYMKTRSDTDTDHPDGIGTFDEAFLEIEALIRAHDLTIEKKLLEALPGKKKISGEDLSDQETAAFSWYNQALVDTAAAIKSVFRGGQNENI